MKTVSLLVLLLSNAGYWFGGREGTVSGPFAADTALPAADLNWELHLDGVRLSSGKLALEAGNDDAAEVRLTPPPVRVRRCRLYLLLKPLEVRNVGNVGG